MRYLIPGTMILFWIMVCLFCPPLALGTLALAIPTLLVAVGLHRLTSKLHGGVAGPDDNAA